MSTVSPNQISALPVIHLVLLLDTREVLIVEGISHESDRRAGSRSGDPWRWRVVTCFATESLSRESLPQPFAPRVFPNALKELAKRKRVHHEDPPSGPSLHDPSLPLVYSLNSISLPSESTRYALILTGVLFVFDWMAVADQLVRSSSSSREADHLISRTPRHKARLQQQRQGWITDKIEEVEMSSSPNIHLSSRASRARHSQVR
jgi:hypothetical protein